MRFIIIFIIMLFAGNAWSKPIANVNIQEILSKSGAGNKAREIVKEVVMSVEKIKLTKENELSKLKSTNDPDFSSKVSEYRNFIKDSQNEIQAVNDKLTTYLVDAIVQTTLNNYQSKHDSICTMDSTKKGCHDIITGKDILGVDTNDAQNITPEVFALFEKESKYYDALMFKAPYLSSKKTGDSDK